MRLLAPWQPVHLDSLVVENHAADHGAMGPLEAAVEGLPDRERLIVETVVYEQATIAEAGRRLGVSRQRAHFLWHRALRRLAAVAEGPPGASAAR